MECCQYRVDPLLLLGLIAAIGGLTFFLQQQGRNCYLYLDLKFFFKQGLKSCSLKALVFARFVWDWRACLDFRH